MNDVVTDVLTQPASEGDVVTQNRCPAVNFATGKLEEPLALRAGRVSRPQVAKRDLLRYYALIADSATIWTLAEADLLVEVVRELRLGADSYRYLHHAIRDEARLWSPEKWHVDQKFFDRVEALTLAEAMAIVDAVERFWVLLEAAGEDANTDELLTQVGLTR